MIFRGLLTLIFISFLLLSCNQEPKKKIITNLDNNPIKLTSIADSIIYDVIIKNPNPEDEWAETCLQNLDRKTLIDNIFDAVLSGKVTAYDYFSEKPYSIEEIKTIIKNSEFKKEQIGKIQFIEKWYFDPETFYMRKEVNSIVLGYEAYNSEGYVKGYKTAFKVSLNNP